MTKRPKPTIKPGMDIKSEDTDIKVNLTREINITRPNIDLQLAPSDKPDQFRTALKVLANNDEYREAAICSPEMILEDFNLSAKELTALRGIAKLSGADITAVDRAVAVELLANPGSLASDIDIDVSCCSCCCCCCGETSIAIA
jgi:hypothetical protein